jgi:cytidine deaminase
MTQPAIYRQLADAARAAAEKAYAPYSNYFVGSAVLTASGQVFTGCNVESKVLGGTICAERTALVKAISEGHRDIQAVAVHCRNNEGWPCGVCRQFIMEFGPEIVVIVESEGGNLICRTISELLPEMPVGAAV